MTGDTKDGNQNSATGAPVGDGHGSSETMESLLAAQAELHEKLEKREVVWVKVIQIQKESVLVDIGEKGEGVIPAAEFPQDEAPKIGRRVPAILVSRGRGDKATILSAAKARESLGWEVVLKSFETKERVRGKVISAVKGGFLVDISGVSGFMPLSLADIRPVRDPAAMVGTGVRCYILELKKEKGQLILSRRAVMEEDRKARRDKLLSTLKPGSTLTGRVSRIGEQGLFVDIGGVEGLVHTSDVSWREPEKAKALFERAQRVRVKVLKVEPETGKIALGVKQLTPYPADALRKKYPPKAVVRGKVCAVLPKEGVRIELAQGDPAFCPLAELPVEGSEAQYEDIFEKGGRGPSSGRGRRPSREDEAAKLPRIWPKEGDEVTGLVTGILPSFEVAVSIRRHEAIQDRKQVARYTKTAPPLTLGQLLNPDSE